MKEKENLEADAVVIDTLGAIDPEKTVEKEEEKIDPDLKDAKMPGQRGSNYTPPTITKAYLKKKKKRKEQKKSRQKNRKK